MNPFHGPNAAYVLELYARYCEDPTSVDETTQALFATWRQAERSKVQPLPPIQQEKVQIATLPASLVNSSLNGQNGQSSQKVTTFDIPQIVVAARLIRLIRELGHLAAHIDPLGSQPPGDPGLEMATHGLTPEYLKLLPADIIASPLAEGATNALEAIDRLREAYAGTIGYEDHHLPSAEERAWIREAAESRRFFQDFDQQQKRELLERLTEVEVFERFIHQTFPGQKRFSLEGNDMLIPMLDSIIRRAALAGTLEVVIGMAHRGRLNVLAHVLGKSYSAILLEFQGPNFYNKGTYLGWAGDVKYHLGARRAYRDSGIFEMPLTLVPNPSHLEFINPVVQGRARAAQEQRDRTGKPEKESKASLPIIIHGDASFAGQGVVAETLNLSRLEGYHVGGTIHIIINNQIGFTTPSKESRSTLYASDLARGFEIPIVHVNADDPEACLAAARMAWAYREKFEKDFLIDLVGYRRWGHNEGDEPTFTQPLMYEIISKHPTVREIWARKLTEQKIILREQSEEILATNHKRLQQAQREVERRGRVESTMAVSISSLRHRPVTPPQNVPAEKLLELNEALLSSPEGFTVNPKLERVLQRRREALTIKGGIEWGHAEALAFATILADGVPIRFTGQDVERGTFSQRHLALYDANTGERHVSLQTLPQAQAAFGIHNSPLSESGTLGFEYGYSSHAPDVLVIWEAQFGDFANGAQVFIDQFLVSGYAKWSQQPALVLLLPNGHEGQGPDHSSGRVERFLQLAAENNIRIANCTTAAQYFHLLRRHAENLQSDPRPLIVMSPKSLLRHPRAASSLTELSEGRFYPVMLPETSLIGAEEITRLILCSGKVYIDLITGVGRANAALPSTIAAARIEELYPFPANDIETLIRSYPNLHEVVWLQEEPQNMGAWNFVQNRLREILGSLSLTYCGRLESASTAEGLHSQHEPEQTRILREVVSDVLELHSVLKR